MDVDTNLEIAQLSKKERKALERQQKKEAALRRIKAQDKLPFWTLIRYKYCTWYFAKKLAIGLFRFILLVGISYVIIYPYLSKIFSSFMGREDFVDVTVKWIAKYPTLDTYKAIIENNGYFQGLLNSTILALVCACIQTLACTLVGYGFSKFKFRFKNILFMLVIFTMIVPHETIQLSLFMKFRYFDIWGLFGGVGNFFSNFFKCFQADSGGFAAWGDAIKQAIAASSETNGAFLGFLRGLKEGLFSGPITGLNLLNTDWPLIIMSLCCIGFKNGLFIYIMRQYFNGVPDELEEAAYVDGAGVYKTFVKIILPMSATMLVTIFMFAFAWQWSDTFYTDMFYTSSKSILLPDIVKVPAVLDTKYAAQTAYESAIRNTCGLLILTPLVILYLFAQRTMIEGVERSGITG